MVVHSICPDHTPSSTLQCDVLRGLRLPALLVVNRRLGSNATINAFSNTRLRSSSYNVCCINAVLRGLRLPVLLVGDSRLGGRATFNACKM